jgi:predicted metalloprotease with PDZ domain
MDYTISYEEPLCHFINIEATFEADGRDTLELRLAAWRPGRYELMHYARNIRRFEVSDSAGNPLMYSKTSPNTWLIHTNGLRGRICLRYDYFAAEMDGGSSWLDDNQLYVNPVNCLIYDPERMDMPCTLNLDLPEGYVIASQLQFDDGVARAETFWHLADSPCIAGSALRHHQCRIEEVVFHTWIQGSGDFDWDRFHADLKRFASLQARIMGGFPFEAYHFLVQFLPYQHYHGVEHFNSTVIVLGPTDDIDSGVLYKQFLGVCSHELFHVWNVCRIRPRELMPYDYSREQYFETGFVAEGITTYCGELFLLRSGVIQLDEFLERFNKYVQRHFENSGRFNRSLTESSVDLWLDGYRETTPGRRVSIYVKGALVAMLLDLKLIAESGGTVRLDKLMQHLWYQYGIPGKGYTKNDLLQGLFEISGKDYTEFFNRHIDGCAPLEHEFEQLLKMFGLKLAVVHPTDTLARFYGTKTKRDGTLLTVTQVAPLSPAYGKLCIKDRILKINGQKPERWHQGDKPEQVEVVKLELERNGKSHTLNLKRSDTSFFTAFELAQTAGARANEVRMQQTWLESV